MTSERFQQLLAAYGADPRRWPEREREGARAFLAADSERERLLFEARQTDAVLDAFTVAPVSHALRDRVIALATQAGLKSQSIRPFRGWAPRVCLAAACAAGVVVGLGATMQYRHVVEADAALYQASLSGLDDSEILG